MHEEHKARWEAFLSRQENPSEVLEDEKLALFKHGWRHPKRTYDEWIAARIAWREAKIAEAQK